MTTAEKVQEIKKAVKSGIPKRRIDVKGNGVIAYNLLQGKNVSDACIDEMYANLLEYHANPEIVKTRRSQYFNMHPDVSQKKKIQAIRNAVKKGAVKFHLDPFGGGSAVRKLEQGLSVSSAKINEMYANLLSLGNQAVPKSPTNNCAEIVNDKASSKKRPERKAKAKTSSTAGKNNKSAAVKRSGPNGQIATLLEKIRILEDRVSELSEALKAKTPLKVKGLTVTQKLDKVKGKGYRRWYAIYRENGIRRWIYIGKDVNQAEEKIQSWFEKNGVQR
jgi:hypothetical protein